MVTTLPAKAGSFRAMRSPWLRQELLRRRVTHPPTLTPEGPIQAHWSRPRLFRGEPLLPVLLPSRGEGIERYSHSRAPHRAEAPKHTGHVLPTGLPHGAPQHIVRVKVPPESATTWIACQVGSALLAQPLADGDPHSPPAFNPESPAEVFYGRGSAGPGVRLLRRAHVSSGGELSAGHGGTLHPVQARALVPVSIIRLSGQQRLCAGIHRS